MFVVSEKNWYGRLQVPGSLFLPFSRFRCRLDKIRYLFVCLLAAMSVPLEKRARPTAKVTHLASELYTLPGRRHKEIANEARRVLSNL